MSKELKRREFLKFLLTSGVVLTGMGSGSTLMSGCQREKEVSVEKVYNFLDHLDEAEIVTPEKEYVQRTSFTIKGERKEVLFEHPDSKVIFRDVPIYKSARLQFGIGIDEAAQDKSGDGVLFEVLFTDEKAGEHRIYSRYIDPKNTPEDRKWFDEVIDLGEFEATKGTLTFVTSSGTKGNEAFDWSG